MSGENNAINTPLPFGVSAGGSGINSIIPYAVICGGNTSTGELQTVVDVGDLGEWLTSNGAGMLPSFNAGSGQTLQVVSSILTTKGFYSNPTVFTDISLSVSITPSSTSSTVLVMAIIYAGMSGGEFVYANLYRGSTAINQGTAGTDINSTSGINAFQPNCIPIFYIDSPATASSVTYSIKLLSADQTGSPTGNLYVNYYNNSGTEDVGCSSTILAMELQV